MGKHGICDHILLINISLLGHYQKARRRLLIVDPTWAWFGANPVIAADGSLTIFETDRYTPEELWGNSKSQIYEVSGVH